MGAVFVRPYPVAQLALGKRALEAFQQGNLNAASQLMSAAKAALLAIDPDAIREPISAHPDAPARDKAALNAAMDVADTWEGVVAIAATISSLPRLRGFLVACAWCRYLDEDDPSLNDFKAGCRGQLLPGLSVEDTSLYALLPGLIGLGPELADEVGEPHALTGTPAWQLLGLPKADWGGVDPLDGLAVTPDECSAALASERGPWRELLARGASDGGLLIRTSS